MTAPTTSSPAALHPTTATPAQLLFPDLDTEIEITRRALARVPEEHVDWKPHDKSMTVGLLASHVAELFGLAAAIVEADELDFAKHPYVPTPYGSTAENVARFEAGATRLRAAVDGMTWDDVGRMWRMGAGDRTFVQGEKGLLLRQFGLTHMAHHRAQLGVYLRLLGVPVPQSYGPTADEP